MLKHIKEYQELNTNLIDIEKLKLYANAIAICCNGEYGEVFYNEKEQKVFVNLGDSTPFNPEDLMGYMQDAIASDFMNSDKVPIEIENECGPSGENWKKYNIQENEFIPWNGW
jgi:ferredoxin